MSNLCVNLTCRPDDEPRHILGGAFLCSPCESRLEHALRELPAQFEELGEWLVRHGGGGEKVSGGQATGLPLNEHVADHRKHMRGIASWWAADVVRLRGVNPPPTAEIQATAPFLVTHARWFAHQEFAAAVYTEFDDARRRAFGLMNPPGRAPIKIGRCVEDCTGTLWTIIRFEDDPRPWCIWCDICGIAYETHQFLRLGERLARRKASA